MASGSAESVGVRDRWELEHGTIPVVGENWHDFILVQAQDIVDNGLPSAYDNVGEFEADLWIGDMPWNDGAIVVMERIEKDPRLPGIRKGWLERFGSDFWDDNWRAEFSA